FKEGWTYSYMARGSFGARKYESSVFAHKSPGMFSRSMVGVIGSLSNCRFAGQVARAISATIQLPEGCVARVPVPALVPDSLVQLESACIQLKRHLIALDPTERSFGGLPVPGASLTEAWRNLANE